MSPKPDRPRYWFCVIGPVPASDIHPFGDGPPRAAVREAIHKSTGHWADCGSGWVEESEAEAMRAAGHADYCRRNGIKP